MPNEKKAPIGIICAMKIEMETVRTRMTDTKSETVSGIELVSGNIEGHPVVTAVCGVGKVFAAICAQTMILRAAPSLIINTGVGGALADSLAPCSIVVASEVLQHDMDTSPIGDPVGYLSGIGKIALPCDESASAALTAAANELGLFCEVGTIATGDQFIDGERKDRVRSLFPQAIACEMEGGAIGQTCYVNRVPFAILRAISDKADGTSPLDYPTFAAMAAKNSAEVLFRFLRTRE